MCLSAARPHCPVACAKVAHNSTQPLLCIRGLIFSETSGNLLLKGSFIIFRSVNWPSLNLCTTPRWACAHPPRTNDVPGPLVACRPNPLNLSPIEPLRPMFNQHPSLTLNISPNSARPDLQWVFGVFFGLVWPWWLEHRSIHALSRDLNSLLRLAWDLKLPLFYVGRDTCIFPCRRCRTCYSEISEL